MHLFYKRIQYSYLIITTLLLSLFPIFSYSQTSTQESIKKANNDIQNFTSSLVEFSKQMSVSMSHTSMMNASISTYKIGGIYDVGSPPHIDIDYAGVFSSPATQIQNISLLKKIVNNEVYPPTLENLSVLPTFSFQTPLSLRIGFGGFPLDFGIRAFYMPVKIGKYIIFTTALAGINTRYMVFPETKRTPGISVGINYTYQHHSLFTEIHNIEIETKDTENISIIVRQKNVNSTLRVDTHTISTPFIMSKRFLNFFEPFIGTEPYFTLTQTTYKSDARLQISRDNGKSFFEYEDYVKSYSQFIDSPYFGKSNETIGISFDYNRPSGGIRFFGGFSFIIGNTWLINPEFSYSLNISPKGIENDLGIAIHNRLYF